MDKLKAVSAPLILIIGLALGVFGLVIPNLTAFSLGAPGEPGMSFSQAQSICASAFGQLGQAADPRVAQMCGQVGFVNALGWIFLVLGIIAVAYAVYLFVAQAPTDSNAVPSEQELARVDAFFQQVKQDPDGSEEDAPAGSNDSDASAVGQGDDPEPSAPRGSTALTPAPAGSPVFAGRTKLVGEHRGLGRN